MTSRGTNTRPHNDTRASDQESGRIIYLGDVRRRRASKSRAPDKYYLLALAGVAFIAWVTWGIVAITVPPARLLTYVAFFTPLWIAVVASCTLGAYALEWQRGFFPSLTVSSRRGVLFATVLVANLALISAHRWTIPAAVLSVLIVVAIEAFVSRRT